jgi:pheromone shutdown protein TraB
MESSPTRQSRIIVPQIQAVDFPALTSSTQQQQQLVASASFAGPSALAPSSKPSKGDNNPLMQAATVAVGNSIKSMYKKLDTVGFDSGEEFINAIKEGRKLGSDIVLGDRDVEVTLRRVTEGLAKTDLKALFSSDSELEQTLQEIVPTNMESKLMSSKDSLNDEEFRQEFSSFVETMKSKENVNKIMNQLKTAAPFLYEALVSERDAYMAAGLNGLNELESIVAVVGIAHSQGIEQNLQMNGWKAENPSCAKYR